MSDPIFDRPRESFLPTRVAVLTAAAMVFAVNCDSIPSQQRGQGTCIVVDDETTDEGFGVDVECIVVDSSASAEVINRSAPQFQPGGTIILAGAANSDPASAAATGTHTTCYEATQPTNVAASVFVNELEFNQFCLADTGFSEVTILFEMTKNGAPLADVVDASAHFDCAAESVVLTGGFLNCSAGGPPGRQQCTGPVTFFPDRTSVVAGDRLTGTFTVTVDNVLEASEPAGDGNVEVETTLTYFLSGLNLVEVPCAVAESCTTNGDCTENEYCLEEECQALRFGTEADATVSTSPDPVEPGQAFDVSFSFDLHGGDLVAYSAEVAVDEDAVTFNGPLFSGLVVCDCDLDGKPMRVQVLPSLDEFLLDVNLNGTANVGEPIFVASVSEGSFRIETQFASLQRLTVPDDATLSCYCPALFDPLDVGTYPISFETVSVDVDTHGADDGAGVDPIVLSGIAFDLVIGDAPAPVCGDADGSGAQSNARAARGGGAGDITASDALRVLRRAVGAVGSGECEDCVCDVDSSGDVTASDALKVLRVAVGQNATLDCPGCD